MANHTLVPILAGGGTRLPAHIGILTALEEMDTTIEHIVGVSGGSIISSMYATGMPLDEIKQAAMDTDFNQFRGFSILSLIKDGGLCNGNKLEDWLDDMLDHKTFADLEKDLHIVATDVRRSKPVIFDRERTPDFKISKAVRYSMSIPLLFSFKPYGNRLMADGSILSEDALHRDWAGDGTPVLCFRLRGEHEYEDIRPGGLFPVTDYVTLLIRTFLTTISREYINNNYWHSTLIINTGKSSPVQFNLDSDQKRALFLAGYDTTTNILPLKLKEYN
ncbi:patatin-like phospholipase family protein [Psychrobium sp. 1_MG-2023]|uniref:patatin-like phospholipase family protein n=1 Tax=Psychrobium sp. 1_MG-2023 TaxID=3062624 RepID=UPI000C326CC5|nr:patatin-like phospholipase family protein [Psychrobium sp. 1_MG-2023]MDP2560936.1 patatin-like phospholipase family protein [Psychrobium sp. 1_MG-2023]PKF56008.1 phospholipase [Alteromonadales bacterium alter-6D02]